MAAALTPIKEFTGSDITGVKLKSKKWTTTENGSTTQQYIAAVCTVDNNGGTSVEYYPTWAKNLADK